MKDRKNVSVEDWLYAGLLAFAEGGEAGVRVERIAQSLGVSKGSYYYYFSSRQEYLERMLDYSLQIGTQDFIDRASGAGDPVERLRVLTLAVFQDRRERDFDFHLRDYARRSEFAARIVKRTDRQRIEFVRNLLIEADVVPGEALLRAEIYYNYYLGWYQRRKDVQPGRRELRAQLEIVARIAGVDLTGAPDPARRTAARGLQKN